MIQTDSSQLAGLLDSARLCVAAPTQSHLQWYQQSMALAVVGVAERAAAVEGWFVCSQPAAEDGYSAA